MLPVQKFRSFIEANQLFSEGGKILLAVSAGKDSVLMAHLFNDAGLSFGIAHCNFGLREEESAADEIFTEELAKRFGVAFYSTRFETANYAAEHKLSIQMAARHLRYEWLEEIRRVFNYECVALAHHLSDSTETVLLNLIRGTGIQGLRGILPKRNHLVRPLLFLTRPVIDDLIAENGIAYREDQSNASDKYARNKIRHHVVPALQELNPRIDLTFQENATRFAEIEEFLETAVTGLREKLFIKQGDCFHIAIDSLKELHPIKLLLFELFRPYGFSEEVLNDLLNSFHKHAGRTFHSSGYRVILDRKKLILEQLKDPLTPVTTVKERDEHFEWGSKKFRKLPREVVGTKPDPDPLSGLFDADKLQYPLTIRSWKEGDFFSPSGMKGRKKLSDFFISLKIPVNEKPGIPVIENGNGDIIWIAGYRISERYTIGRQTKKVVIFECYE